VRFQSSSILDLKAFNSKDRCEAKARNWLSKTKAVFRREELTADQMCMEFPRCLKARQRTNWYRQLKASTKGNRKNLLAAFQTEFCGDAISPLHKYYEMRRMPTEDYIDYLYRLKCDAPTEITKAAEKGRSMSSIFSTRCNTVI